MADRGYPLSVP